MWLGLSAIHTCVSHANKDEYLYFRAWDDARRCRKALESGGGSWGGFTARNLDGDSLPWQVARLRRNGT